MPTPADPAPLSARLSAAVAALTAKHERAMRVADAADTARASLSIAARGGLPVEMGMEALRLAMTTLDAVVEDIDALTPDA